MKKEPILLLIIAGVLIVFWMVSSVDRRVSPLPDGQDASPDVIDQNSGAPQDALTQSSCETAGGTWNACGSACRTQPDAVCIELCVEYCECQESTQCPDGFSCGDIINGVGVCL